MKRLVLVLALFSACAKVELVNASIAFTLADAVWFEQEQTLFVFYRVEAEQGIEPPSTIELKYRTDNEVADWKPLSAYSPVHTHIAIDCGPRTRCGSWSVKVPLVPREVGLRLRFQPDGPLALNAPIQLSVIGPGPAHSNRSLVLYGVFDEGNKHVQWRSRHQFPNLRNEQVEGFGLRRWFQVRDARAGDVADPGPQNPYWYATDACTGLNLNWPVRETLARAVFEQSELPLSTSANSTVCATTTVIDATGTFVAFAVARKNPEVRPGFPTLRSPVATTLTAGFLLKFCNRSISAEHLAMQEQRLLLSGNPIICLDDWDTAGFVERLRSRLGDDIEVLRRQGRDVILTFSFHHDDETGRLATVLENVLAAVLGPERGKSSPRVVGALVFDSLPRALTNITLRPLVLWCPATVNFDDLDSIMGISPRSCPLIPDNPDLILGPVRLNSLPILPSRKQYLTFIGKYGAANAGRMRALEFFAPLRTPLSVDVPIGDIGFATFFNNEIFTPAASDALSYCAPITNDEGNGPCGPTGTGCVVFQVASIPTPLPLQALPQFHRVAPQPAYSIGLGWDSPFLLRLDYEVIVGADFQVLSFSVPFGIKTVEQSEYSNTLWKLSTFDLSRILTQCTRFCDAPTFDSGGVYNVQSPFRTTYESQCYSPKFPTPDDGEAPLDP
jgi:hypothetical protein